MADSPNDGKQGERANLPADRQRRLAEALRANLKKRKAQSRARAGRDAAEAPGKPSDDG